MNDNSTFPEPGSDLTVMILSTGPEEPGELLPWAADPNWQPPAEWTATTATKQTPEDLWRAGQSLTADELSSLLEDCTGHTVESTNDDEGKPIFFLRSPGGERLEPDYPFEDLETVEDLVGWRIDEALAVA